MWNIQVYTIQNSARDFIEIVLKMSHCAWQLANLHITPKNPPGRRQFELFRNNP